MHRKPSEVHLAASCPEDACCRRSSSTASRTNRRPLPREADLGWERAAYLALYDKA